MLCSCVYMSTMSLEQEIRKTFNIDKMGGTLIARDSSTIIVYNIEALCDEQVEHLVRFYPNLSVTIHSSSTSHSGFMVVISLATCHELIFSSNFLGVLVCSCIYPTVLSMLMA